MRAMSLEQIVAAVEKAQIVSKRQTEFTGIGTDTRQDLKGQLFVALKGEAYDAHQFLDKAVAAGAAGVLVHELPTQFNSIGDSVTVIKVADTLKALQQMGRWARRQSAAKVVGITGSNGKTTTKEFTAALLGTAQSVHFNRGSFNNHWGVPFTLLQLPTDKDVAVVEMGMNHAGEITELVGIAEPDVVVCTTVGRAHIEFFGTIEKIADAKEEIYLSAKPNATRIFNLDQELTRKMLDRAKAKFAQAKTLTFSSKHSEADVYLKIDNMSLKEIVVSGSIGGLSGSAVVPVFGSQNLTNLMAAACIGMACGMSAVQIWQGLSACRTNWGRNQLVTLKSGAQLIFDGYNANPDSMRALLDNVQRVSIAGKKIGVFGQMLEMGELSAELHEELGHLVGQTGFDQVYFVGHEVEAFRRGLQKAEYQGQSFLEPEFKESVAVHLSRELQGGDLAVVKGSRGMKLERFVLPCEPVAGWA